MRNNDRIATKGNIKERKANPRSLKPVRGELWTAAQVGGRLNLSEKTLYNWKAAGELPFDYFYINGNLRFDSADIEDYVTLSKVRSNKIQFDPYRVMDWIERTEQQLADMKDFVSEHIRAGKLAKA
jgi:predicted DNA-binding transcriptional regulator AlpA